MKSATLFLVSVLIFAFTSPSLSTSILTVDEDLVLDASGNPVEKGVLYTISPPIWPGGAVKLATPLNNETCEAVDVIQDPNIIFPVGTPFTFVPVDLREESIKLGYPLAIQSPTENPCDKSTVWQVSNRLGVDVPIITTGGSFNTGPSCLRITKPLQQNLINIYVFEHCPYMCGGAKICRTVGIYQSESGVRHLATNVDAPFQFILIKNSVSATKKI